MDNGHLRILAVDDEPRSLRLMRLYLESAGYEFGATRSGEEAIGLLTQQSYDLAILELGMAGTPSGFELIECVRDFSDLPIIVLTALTGEADKVRALKLGADEYLTKPIGQLELCARVEAILRRYHSRHDHSPAQQLGDLRIDLAQHRVFHRDEEVRLSKTEYRLLLALLRNAGKVVSQGQLVHEVWGPSYSDTFEGLRVYVHRLRQKLESDPENPRYLVTFPGIGYLLTAPEMAAETAPETEAHVCQPWAVCNLALTYGCPAVNSDVSQSADSASAQESFSRETYIAAPPKHLSSTHKRIASSGGAKLSDHADRDPRTTGRGTATVAAVSAGALSSAGDL
jgi:two-component system, OmpR family, KDP operon response regulator KdpE